MGNLDVRGVGVWPNELPPSGGWPWLVENIKLFSKPSEAIKCNRFAFSLEVFN